MTLLLNHAARYQLKMKIASEPILDICLELMDKYFPEVSQIVSEKLSKKEILNELVRSIKENTNDSQDKVDNLINQITATLDFLAPIQHPEIETIDKVVIQYFSISLAFLSLRNIGFKIPAYYNVSNLEEEYNELPLQIRKIWVKLVKENLESLSKNLNITQIDVDKICKDIAKYTMYYMHGAFIEKVKEYEKNENYRNEIFNKLKNI